MDIVYTTVDVWRVRKTVGWIKYSSVGRWRSELAGILRGAL